MSFETLRPSPALKDFLPIEYKDLVEHGPYGKGKKVSDMGKFKEIIEEHPMCAGCAMTLFIRLMYIGMPNPEHTIVVGTAGCGRLALSQALYSTAACDVEIVDRIAGMDLGAVGGRFVSFCRLQMGGG